MANFLSNNNTVQTVSPRQALTSRYANCRNNLLLVIAFTVVNIVLAVSNSNKYFLFSAFVPYVLADFGMLFSGMYPAEYYTETWGGVPPVNSVVLIVALVIAAVILVMYLLSWIFSKKHVGWLIFALVFFAIDTAGMLLMAGISMENIVDIIFHAWVIVSLAMGIHAYFKLKELPAEEPVAVPESMPTAETVPAAVIEEAPAEESTVTE